MKLKGNQINELATEIHKGNIKKGFWKVDQTDVNETRIKLLVISELFEMFEADRKGKVAKEIDTVSLRLKEYEANINDIEIKKFFLDEFVLNVKDSKEDELADTMIRLLDYAGFLKVDFLDERFNLKPNKKDKLGIYGDFIEDLNNLIEMISFSLDNPVPTNIAYCYLILLEFADVHNIDLLTHINLKLAYNATRSKMHGKKY